MAYAAVAEETPAAVLAALSRDDVDLARPPLVGTRHLQVEERQLLAKPFQQRLERAALDLHARDLPEALAVGRHAAKESRHRRAAGNPGDAVLSVGLPEPVRRKLGQCTETLLALPRFVQLRPVAAREQVHYQIHHAAPENDEQQYVQHLLADGAVAHWRRDLEDLVDGGEPRANFHGAADAKRFHAFLEALLAQRADVRLVVDQVLDLRGKQQRLVNADAAHEAGHAAIQTTDRPVGVRRPVR